MTILSMVLSQPVSTEVVTRYPKYRMDMVRALTGSGIEGHQVFVLDEQGGTMNSIVRRFADLRRTHPCKVHFIQTGILNPLSVCPRDLNWNVAEVFLDYRFKEIALLSRQ